MKNYRGFHFRFRCIDHLQQNLFPLAVRRSRTRFEQAISMHIWYSMLVSCVCPIYVSLSISLSLSHSLTRTISLSLFFHISTGFVSFFGHSWFKYPTPFCQIGFVLRTISLSINLSLSYTFFFPLSQYFYVQISFTLLSLSV